MSLRYSVADMWARDLHKAEAEGRVEYAEDLKIVRDQGQKTGHALVKVWRGKAKKPYANFRFPSVGSREKWIIDQIRSARESRRFKEELKQKKQQRTSEMRERIQVGTLLHYSWGYEQTQCEFFQVVERKGAYAIVRRIGSRVVENSQQHMSDRRKPARDKFVGEPFRKKITDFGLSMDFGHATPCDDESAFYCSWYH